MPKTVCQSVAWFKRYKPLKSVTVGRVAQLAENSHIQRKLARPSASLVINRKLKKVNTFEAKYNISYLWWFLYAETPVKDKWKTNKYSEILKLF